EDWMHNIVFDDVHFTLRTTRKDVSEMVGGNFDFRWTAPNLQQAVFKHDVPGIYARYVDGLHIHNSSISWQAPVSDFSSSAVELEDFRNLDVNGFRGSEAPGSSAAAFALSNGEGVSIMTSTAATGTRVFL